MPYRMKRFLWPVGLPLLMLALAAMALFALPAAPGQAVAGGLQAVVAAPVEAWRLGVTSEGDAGYNAVIGRLVDASASFRSNRGVRDIYYIFPAPASARTVKSAALNIISRSGTYTSTASLTLEVRSSSGALAAHRLGSAGQPPDGGDRRLGHPGAGRQPGQPDHCAGRASGRPLRARRRSGRHPRRAPDV